MSEKRLTYALLQNNYYQIREVDADGYCRRLAPTRIIDLLNEQQAMIEELKTHNLQHFLEWLVIERYVTDEPMKDINNVIDCVTKFKEYLTDECFETIRGELNDE